MTAASDNPHWLPTEAINPNTRNIDLISTRHILEKLNSEDQDVPMAVARAIPDIAQVVDVMTASMAFGGRVFYVGAGTSGRLGVLDASECPPTFGTEPHQFQGIIAGGEKALRHAIEGAEDDPEAGYEAIEAVNLQPDDVVVGLSASGGAKFVIGAIEAAKRCQAATACITCNGESPLANIVRYPIVVRVGPEPIAGSTRMKAGTAQKLVLNMLSTATMIQQGKTYENLMVDVQPTNAKLKDRAVRIVSHLGRVSNYLAQETLEKTGYSVKPAVVMCRLRVGLKEAEDLLSQAHGKLRVALGDEESMVDQPQAQLELEEQTAPRPQSRGVWGDPGS